ncbi:hypothetical protein CISIN_1g032790mg [Citrus sinensis]|uniref:Uncharacterized protein n=1 Tax=Citrus sinensis TaxID=2711 RepID=A0A067DW92_CITSI|nr:hypothetical protein CISIN_1g032790mg [Citrus sinensis]
MVQLWYRATVAPNRWIPTYSSGPHSFEWIQRENERSLTTHMHSYVIATAAGNKRPPRCHCCHFRSSEPTLRLLAFLHLVPRSSCYHLCSSYLWLCSPLSATQGELINAIPNGREWLFVIQSSSAADVMKMLLL